MSEVKGEEYNITHEQFIDGVTETIQMTLGDLKVLKESYRKTKDPFCKKDIEGYKKQLADLVGLLKQYTNRIECRMEVQPFILFTDGKALFGFKGKKDIEFSKKWYNRIVKKGNDKEMVS